MSLHHPEVDRGPFVESDIVRRALEALALALNHGLEPEQRIVYAFALHDLMPEDVRFACVSMASSERFWPKPIDIRERAVRLARERAAATSARLALPASTDLEPTYRCLMCLDDKAGWQFPKRCPTDARCERAKEHPPHTFTARCPCWLARNAARLDLRRQERLQKGRSVPADCDALNDLREGRYRWEKPWS